MTINFIQNTYTNKDHKLVQQVISKTHSQTKPTNWKDPLGLTIGGKSEQEVIDTQKSRTEEMWQASLKS